MSDQPTWRGEAQCTARSSRSGEQCRRAPVKGATVCPTHGGLAPQVKAAAARRTEEAAAAVELQKDVTKLGLTVVTSPADAMLDALNRAYADVLVTGAKVAQLEPDSWKQLDAAQRFQRPSVWVELYWQALDRYARIADTCTARGIEAAAVGLAHSYAQQLMSYTRALVVALGHDPEEPRVVEHVQASLRAVEAGAA